MKRFSDRLLSGVLCVAGVVLVLLLPVCATAQYTLVAGDQNLEISAFVSAYYNHRLLKDGEVNRKNNRFSIRDLQIDLEGRKGNAWEARLQMDLADLANTASAAGQVLDAENPGLLSAYVAYKALPVRIQLGYDKVPYSLGSLNSFARSPYWSRSRVYNGDLFSRRDVGVMLSSSLWRQRINLYAGVYSGLGESIITSAGGDNDASGQPEFVGRADVSWPARYRYRQVDEACTPIPLFRLGANARYTDKTQPAGQTLPAGVGGEYGIRVVDGKRLAYGLDASFAWKGFAAQAEWHRLRLEPGDPSSPLFANTGESFNKGRVYAGGFSLEGSYYYKPARSVIAVRYDRLNLNDLVAGESEWLNVACMYRMDGVHSALKIQYYRPLQEDAASDPLKWDGQVRIGWQYLF